MFALLREAGPFRKASLVLVGGPGGHGAIDACATLMRLPGPCACVCTRAAK